MQKIYCVEDDESVRELVIYALQSSGFEAQGFVNAEEFFPVRPLSYPDHAFRPLKSISSFRCFGVCRKIYTILL